MRACSAYSPGPLPVLPLWLTVHRELRASARIRAVYGFLSQAIAPALASGNKSSTMADSPQE